VSAIELRGLRVGAIVGVLPEERLRAQPLEIDLDLERELERAAVSDDLAATTNYAEVLRRVAALVDQSRFALLEGLASAIAEEVLAFDPDLDAVVVAVRKLRPPVPEDVDTVGVRLRVAR
jgi:dihydroneopterin aldolase